MIRKFIDGDQFIMRPNRFSKIGDLAHVFADDEWVKHTLDDESGRVKCILSWMEIKPREYAIFFLMEDGCNMSDARQLKKFLDGATLKLQPKSCITYSVDCDVLNRWHVFFGFKLDETDGRVIDGVKFNKWVINWA